MARQLYRIYLYVVFLGMLTFAAVGVYMLLGTLLAQTPLRGTAPQPSTTETAQNVTFAVVAWLIAGIFGGVHYWLIRRDMREDKAASTGAIRAFFINAAEAIAVLVAVIALSSTISQMAYTYSSYVPDASYPLAVGLAALGVAVFLEWERRTVIPVAGVGRVFQRLHLYGVPLLILLTTISSAIMSAVNQSLVSIVAAQGLYSPCGGIPIEKFGENAVCTLPSVGLLWGGTIIPIVAWLGYGVFARGDLHSGLRQVLHLIGFGYGLLFTVIGLERGLELLLLNLMGRSTSWADVVGPYEFVSPLALGLLVSAAYGLWLRRESAGLPMGASNTGMAAEAIAAGILAVPFWWGVGLGLDLLFERVVPDGIRPLTNDVATAVALIVAGIAFIPVALHLRRRSAMTGQTVPRRAYVLASVAAGIVTLAVGGAIALYALGTQFLGAPLADWQRTARIGVVVLVVGATLAGIYIFAAMRERFFTMPRRHQAAVPAPVALAAVAPVEPRDAIDQALDELIAGRVTHDEAAARIRAFTHQPV